METTPITDVIWITLAAFAGFEIALAANYLCLKLVLRAVRAGLERPAPGASRKGTPSAAPLS